jgi:NADH-quinone oxidoreductase subunit E
MFNLSPVGRYHVQLCGTTPCMLRGANELKKVCERVIGPEGKVTPEGVFSWVEVECLGACVNAPMAQINKDYYEDLTPESFEAVLEGLRRGRNVKPGPQTRRQFSAPLSGPKTLLDQEIFQPRAASTGGVPERAAQEQRIQDKAQAAAEAAIPVKGPAAKGGGAARVRELRAGFLEKPEGPMDDLTKISGIDPQTQSLLNDMGLYHFRQLLAWTDEDRKWVETRLPRFKGKTADWMRDAQALLETHAPGGVAPSAAGRRQGKTKDKD